MTRNAKAFLVSFLIVFVPGSVYVIADSADAHTRHELRERVWQLEASVERLQANDKAKTLSIKRLCEEVGLPEYRCPTTGVVRLTRDH